MITVINIALKAENLFGYKNITLILTDAMLLINKFNIACRNIRYWWLIKEK